MAIKKFNTVGGFSVGHDTVVDVIDNNGNWVGNIISVSYGGLGTSSLNANAVVLGNGTSSVKTVSPGNVGNVLTSDGNTWISKEVKTTVTTSSSAPTSSVAGDLWWDTDIGTLFVYYFDGNSYQWVESTPQVLVEGPVGTFTLTGNLIATGDVTVQGTLYETSDVKLKKDIKTIVNAVDTVSNLRGVTFNWIKNDKTSMGLIAQETEQVLPFIVQEDPTGGKSINYTALIGILVESIKELNVRVTTLEKSLSTVELMNSTEFNESTINTSIPTKDTWWTKFRRIFIGN